VTLFVTPDWREISPFPTRKLLARLPWIRQHVYQAPILPRGTMRIDRHPDFVSYLRELPRVEVAHHGLHHVSRGDFLPVEFRGRSRSQCGQILNTARRIFEDAGLPVSPGLQAPGWELSEALAGACADVGLRFVCSARDVLSDVTEGARADMSGLKGMPLFEPVLLADGALVHVTSNFHATSRPERAAAILDRGGVLAIKAHIVKRIGSYVARDGVDDLYANYLDLLFSQLDQRYGSSLWWCTLGEMAERVHASAAVSGAAPPE
jgi:hypothetical protein